MGGYEAVSENANHPTNIPTGQDVILAISGRWFAGEIILKIGCMQFRIRPPIVFRVVIMAMKNGRNIIARQQLI